jgi:hypothetical protein
MKYKEQALNKIEKLENQFRTLEMGVNRGFPVNEIQKTIDTMKAIVEQLRSNISIESDEWGK